MVDDAGIVAVLGSESVEFFQQGVAGTFLTGTQWTPLFADAHYGILPLVVGTLLVAVIAPRSPCRSGLLTAIYLSEYRRPAPCGSSSPPSSILAGMPTVVYGYFALTFVTPFLHVRARAAGVQHAAGRASSSAS